MEPSEEFLQIELTAAETEVVGHHQDARRSGRGRDGNVAESTEPVLNPLLHQGLSLGIDVAPRPGYHLDLDRDLEGIACTRHHHRGEAGGGGADPDRSLEPGDGVLGHPRHAMVPTRESDAGPDRRAALGRDLHPRYAARGHSLADDVDVPLLH